MNTEVKFYWSLFLKRLPVMAVIFMIFAAIGVALALTLPPQYRSSAILLVESAQIPDELASSTVQTPSREQLEIVEQRLLRRANLIDIANQLDIFEGERRMNPDEVVSEMRSRTNLISSVGRDRATLMTISFSAEEPRIAAGVVNEFTSLVLNEDSVRRQQVAEQTLEFFELEVARLDQALAQSSADIVSFKGANSTTLPENLEIKLDRQARLLEVLDRAQEEIAQLRAQRNRLVELGTAAISNNTVQRSRSETELASIESELAQAKLLFSETNPRVRVLEARVAALQSQVAAERGITSEQADPAQAILDLQLNEIDHRVDQLTSDIERAGIEIAAVEEDIAGTPETAIQLDALERDYLNTQSQYNAAINNLAKAQTGERIEVLAKGQRITVIEQAVPPTEPTSPNRPLIAGGGVFLGAALAAAFFVLSELLNRSIRRPADLVSSLGVQPLATIPYLETTGTKRRKRTLSTVALLVLALGIPVALWLVHYYYLPLDLIASRIIDRLGL